MRPVVCRFLSNSLELLRFSNPEFFRFKLKLSERVSFLDTILMRFAFQENLNHAFPSLAKLMRTKWWNKKLLDIFTA